MTNREIFSRIYRERGWHGDGIESSFSGPGSSKSAAFFYVTEVMKFIREHDIKSVVDIGHGDWFMWPPDSFKDIEYFGIDAADGISNLATIKFGRSNIVFKSADFTEPDVDIPLNDLVLIKDVLGHLTIHDVGIILSKLSFHKYVIICEGYKKISLSDIGVVIRRYFSVRSRLKLAARFRNPFVRFPILDDHLALENKDIEPGCHRVINLNKPPFDIGSYGLLMLKTMDYQGHDFKVMGNVKRIWFLKGINSQ